MSKLYVVATPIGHLKDITLRALEVLKSVDVVFAEDTRVAKKLLSHYGILKPMESFHKYSPVRIAQRAIKLLEEGKNIALITDAGTPGISDPGYYLIRQLVAHGFGDAIVTIPGASSLSAIISVSDIDCGEFLFVGFPPHKKGRKTLFERIAKNNVPVIIFESPHRIQKTLKELEVACGDRYVNIGRELTKIYEEIFRGKLSDSQKYFVDEKERGEFVLILDKSEVIAR